MTQSSEDAAWLTIEDLFDGTLGHRASPENLLSLKKLERERAEVKEFFGRAFRLMAISKFSAKDISPGMAWAMSNVIPGLLPGAWGHIVPPFTFGDRHKLIDAYLATNGWRSFSNGAVLLEMGCGFPPTTAVDAARNFPDWQVVAADPYFDPYVLYDADGSYACMDSTGRVRYFHPASASLAAFMEMYRDTASTFRRFQEQFDRLVVLLPRDDNGESVSVTHEGARLVRNPIKTFAQPNLHFIPSQVGGEAPLADVVRIFNVLLYFDARFRQYAEEWVLRTLRPKGIFLCGSDGAHTTDARYSVYQEDNGRLVPREFAFSLDNLRPFTMNPWFCLHNGERETYMLANLMGVVRSDERFRSDYDARVDDLLAESRIWERHNDGFLASSPNQLPSTQWLSARAAMNARLTREGFADHAVILLNRAGFKAWLNEVGHIAVDPCSLPFFNR